MLGRITARAQTCAITAWVFRDKCVQLIAIECLILPPLGYIGGIHSIHSHRNYRTRKADPSALKKMISTDGQPLHCIIRMSDAVYIVPTSLVMRKTACFYCGRESTADSHVLVYNYGIRHCEEHRATAGRDIRAFLHTSGLVDVEAAEHYEPLRTLCKYLTAKPVSVLRTNGNVSDGWQLSCTSSIYECEYIAHIEGTWCVPMFHTSGITKHVPLHSFLHPQVQRANRDVFDDTWYASIEESVALLEKGIYESDYAQQRDKTQIAPQESEHVTQVCTAEGPTVRVFAP